MQPETESLIEAATLLEEKRRKLASGPMAIFELVLHAEDYVNKLLREHLRGEEAHAA